MTSRKSIIKLMTAKSDFLESEGDYVPTLKDTKFYYSILNRFLFENKLTQPKFKIFRLRGSWGYFLGMKEEEDIDEFEIVMTNRFPSIRTFIIALAHEMVHQHQWEILGKIDVKKGKSPNINHGPTFFCWREKFSTLNIPLNRSFR